MVHIHIIETENFWKRTANKTLKFNYRILEAN